MRRVPHILSLLLSCVALGAITAAAQDSSSSNILRNGSFDSNSQTSNLWTGVDSGGYLAGNRASVPVLGDNGITGMAMPVSVAVADMNGDGLPDIISMDPTGYLWVYFNSGTKTQPKFTVGELAPVFLSRPTTFDNNSRVVTDLTQPRYMRQVPHIAITKILKSGKPDLLIGNYEGDIILLPNSGTPDKPVFNQPSDVTKLFIPTSKDRTQLWGNVLAPCTWDWNKDGREDLLVGEGSYSANNIHLLINQGMGSSPVFDESQHYNIAYGDGKQQLSPCVVDYNGDGFPDLLVADRSGHIGLYLNKGGKWKPGVELPFDSYLSAGGDSSSPLSFGGACTVATGDLRGTGLFDLVVGTQLGRISMVKNDGTKTAPKFSAPEDISTGQPGTQLNTPSEWSIDTGLMRGNFYAYASVVTAADDAAAKPPNGKSCLKFGYTPSPNKIIAPPNASDYLPADPGFDMTRLAGKDRTAGGDLFNYDLGTRPAYDIFRRAPGNFFVIRQTSLHLKAGAKYKLSMKIKGDRVQNGIIFIAWRGDKTLSAAKIIRNDRGSFAVQTNTAIATGFVNIPFNAGTQWAEFKNEFKTTFTPDSPTFKGITDLSTFFEITFQLAPGEGNLYLSDVILAPE